MDGAKSVTDTADLRNECGRQASCKGRSFLVKGNGPYRNENPGGSRIYIE